MKNYSPFKDSQRVSGDIWRGSEKIPYYDKQFGPKRSIKGKKETVSECKPLEEVVKRK